jgi:hypothetical protein
MFSLILGQGYNIFMCYLIAYLMLSVTETLFSLPVAFTIFILFIIPTVRRIILPTHRFVWLKYF